MPVWPNGVGSLLGPSLVTGAPLFTSGTVRYAHFTNGSDSNAGTDPEAPKKTAGAAVAASSTRDWVVLQDGHEETVTSTITPTSGVVIVGEGSSGGLPTVKLTLDSAANAKLFTVSFTGVQLRNLWIKANAQANTSARVDVAAAAFIMSGCYVECGSFDDNAGLRFATSGDYAVVENTTFISTATSVATQPHSAIRIGAAVSFLRLNGVTLSGGSNGFANPAFYADGGAVDSLRAEAVSLLLGADAQVNASTTGFFMPTTTTGGARVVWAI